MKSIKTIFIGTSHFGLPSLESLHQSADFEISRIITQPDKKVGRKQELTPSAIKRFAVQNNIGYLQPEKISTISEDIKSLNPDLIIVAAYGQIIPKEILDLPKYGCLNIHGSLLPRYRGAACVQRPIINGDAKTGVTLMKMDQGLDTGPIISQHETTIQDTDTAESLHDRLSALAAKHICSDIVKYIKGELIPMPQNEAESSYVRTLKKSDGLIDWTKSAAEVERFIRAMQPWPGAFTNFEFRISNFEFSVKLIRSSNQFAQIKNLNPGSFFVNNQKLFIQCADSALEILELQPAGKNKMTAKEFINGYLNSQSE